MGEVRNCGKRVAKDYENKIMMQFYAKGATRGKNNRGRQLMSSYLINRESLFQIEIEVIVHVTVSCLIVLQGTFLVSGRAEHGPATIDFKNMTYIFIICLRNITYL